MPNDPNDNLYDLSAYGEATVSTYLQHRETPQPDPQPEPEPQPQPQPQTALKPQPAPKTSSLPEPVRKIAEKLKSFVQDPNKKWILPFIGIGLVLVIAAWLAIVPALSYRVCERHFEEGDYSAAARSFKLAGRYEDAKERAVTAANANAYELGVQAYENGDYAEAESRFKEAGDYKDAKKKLTLSSLGVSFAKGESLMQDGDYAEAAKMFAAAKSFPGAADRMKDAYEKYASQMLDRGSYVEAVSAFFAAGDSATGVSCVEKMLENGRYSDVITAAEKVKDASLDRYKSYSEGMLQLQKGEYAKAIGSFAASDGVLDTYNRLAEANYGQGEILFNQKDYEAAAACFEKAGTFSDAVTKLTTSRFLIAEKYYADGSLNTAKSLYEKIPTNCGYNGVTVADRLATLEKYKAYLPLCGTWSASDSANRIKTISSSSRYYWIGKPGSSRGEITVKCVIGSDGKVTVRGEVKFYRYSNFADTSILLRTKEESFTINQTVTKANFSVKIGNLTLSHSAKGYRARWQIKEKPENTTYTYSADYTYNVQKTLY